MIARRYIRLARSQEFLDPCLPDLRGQGTGAVLAYLEAEAEEMGVGIEIKRHRRPLISLIVRANWNALATTGPHTIWVPEDWERRSRRRRARLLACELAHSRQWRGLRAFGARYLAAGFRWAVEVHDRCEGLAVRWALDERDSQLRAYIRAQSKSITRAYRLERLGEKTVETYTLAILQDRLAELRTQ